jgi:hypothetical protein
MCQGEYAMQWTVRKTLIIVLLAALCAAGSGCAGNNLEERPEIDRARVFNHDFDAVWKQLLLAVTTGDEEISMADKSTGVISFKRFIPVKKLGTYAFDDSGMLMSNASANVVVHVRAQSPARTYVLMNAKFTASGKTALDVFLSRERQVLLDSKGWLEREYFDRLAETLTGTAVKPQ